MPDTADTRQLYIVLSQTGTWLSRAIKIFTRARYNHASLSFSEDLQQMYSFGRLRPRNPFLAGFVQENAFGGTFARFPKTKALVIALPVSEAQYTAIRSHVTRMYASREEYHYNFLGILCAAVHIAHTRDFYYYCSEFVAEVLQTFTVEGAEQLRGVIQPEHLLRLPHSVLYQGLLREYTPPSAPSRCFAGRYPA